MSKERELLNRCAVNLRVRNICPLLLKEVSELLNEPQQEPIAWAIVFDAEPNKVCEDYLSPYKEDLEVVMEKGFCKGDIPRLRPLYIAHETLREHVDRNEELLAQPKRDKVDFQTLNEMGLRRLQVSDNLVLQESCSRSPTLIFAENGNLIEIIGYKKLLEIRSFIDEILNYADTPTRKPLMTDSDIYNHTPFHYHDAEQKAFAVGVRWAEQQHKIGADDE